MPLSWLPPAALSIGTFPHDSTVAAVEILELDGGDPLEQFRRWYAEAPADLPQAMALATATADGAPSVRMVLLKEADERGVVFFTNYESRKGRELAANPQAALLLY